MANGKAKRGDRLARIAVAKGQISYDDTSAAIAADRTKVAAVNAEHGISFNASNAIIRDDILDKIDELVALFNATFNRNVSERLELVTSNIDADTVTGNTVETDVPAGAVFTDTVYDDTALAARVTALENP